jgi:hypothetical protein
VLVVSDALMAGNVRMLRSDSAVGSFLLGLHEKREKVPHPGLQVQHVHGVRTCMHFFERKSFSFLDSHKLRAA